MHLTNPDTLVLDKVDAFLDSSLKIAYSQPYVPRSLLYRKMLDLAYMGFLSGVQRSLKVCILLRV